MSFFIENNYGNYSELIELSVRDLTEIKIGIESKKQEDTLEKYI